MSDVKEILGNYSSDIIKSIEEDLSVIVPNNLQEASLYLTKAGGKMLRPALCLITAEAVGGKKEDALKTGSAIELIHTFSLIHDDIMDDDDMRRGMPSVHMVWGEDVAILAGDTLFSKAFEIIIKSEGTSHSQNNQALATVADACVKICEGQASDMGFEDRFDVTEDEYMEMIFKKTGALIAAATKAGAIMGGASDDVIDAMYEYGRLTVFGETVAGFNVIDKISQVKRDRYDRPVTDVRIISIKPDEELNQKQYQGTDIAVKTDE